MRKRILQPCRRHPKGVREAYLWVSRSIPLGNASLKNMLYKSSHHYENY